MIQISDKIIDYLVHKEKKRESIKYQKYEITALSRDTERKLSLEII